MRIAAIATLCVSSLLAGGCLSSIIPEHTGQVVGDGGQQQQGSGSTDLATAGSGGGGDLATVGSALDGGSSVAPGSLQFGQVCTTGADCMSTYCQPANMGANMECTIKCTMLGVADPTCPGPGGVGTGGLCNQKGFCKPT